MTLSLLADGLPGFVQLFMEWNAIVLLIAACSILGLTIFLERLISLRRAERHGSNFVVGVRTAIREGDLATAIGICEEQGGCIANIVKAGLLRAGREQGQIEGAMELQGLVEIANLEKNAKILSIIARITPLIGLLGTVLGFIQAFSEMRRTGLMDISTSGIGAAMEYALVTTAAGLVVAIPAIVAYNYLVSRVGHMVLEMQTTSAEVVDLLLQDGHAV